MAAYCSPSSIVQCWDACAIYKSFRECLLKWNFHIKINFNILTCGVGYITKNSANVFSECRKRRLKETGRGDWESPPLYIFPQRQHERGGVAGRLTSPRTLVVGSLYVRGCSSIESKRCEIGCMFGRRGMDVLALCETKMKGKGEVAFGEVTGRVSGVERGRAREGVALLSEWMRNKVVEWKEVSSRLMWVRVRMGRECWAFVSAYVPGCERSEEERDEFWNDLTRCVDGLSTRNYVVVLGDLNARVGDGEVEGVVGKYGVPGENESGERLLDMCVEQELVIGNTFFKKKGINKYTWIRVANGSVIERALMDYVLITKRMVGRLKDVHVFRGVAAGMSDHFLVEAEVVVAKEWGNRVVACRREVVKVEELKKTEKKQEYLGQVERGV